MKSIDTSPSVLGVDQYVDSGTSSSVEYQRYCAQLIAVERFVRAIGTIIETQFTSQSRSTGLYIDQLHGLLDRSVASSMHIVD